MNHKKSKIYKGENNMINQTALQVTNFNFYGDDLIALKDNATGEVYTAINSVLKGIGFTDRNQIRKRRDKWINDAVVSKGICIFNIPTSEGVPKNDTPMNHQDVFCISQHKLPMALAKINITPKMKREQPELAAKLELYQDKCADVLASVFIDNKSISDIKLDAKLDAFANTFSKMTDTLSTLTKTVITLQQDVNTLKNSASTTSSDARPSDKQPQVSKKRWSYWSTKMFPKYQLLTDYFHIDNKTLYKNLYDELKNMYPDIDLNQMVDDYCYENHLESCYTLEVIEHNLTLRKLFESLVDSLLEKYHLNDTSDIAITIPTIFNKSNDDNIECDVDE